jgi:hypothetical protein
MLSGIKKQKKLDLPMPPRKRNMLNSNADETVGFYLNLFPFVIIYKNDVAQLQQLPFWWPNQQPRRIFVKFQPIWQFVVFAMSFIR